MYSPGETFPWRCRCGRKRSLNYLPCGGLSGCDKGLIGGIAQEAFDGFGALGNLARSGDAAIELSRGGELFSRLFALELLALAKEVCLLLQRELVEFLQQREDIVDEFQRGCHGFEFHYPIADHRLF